MPKPEKVALVAEIQETLASAQSVVLTETLGLTVEQSMALRRKLRESGASLSIYKNTLINIAANNLGIEGLESHLHGPTALSVSLDEPSSAMKALRDFMKTNDKVKVRAGLLGKQVLTLSEVHALADLPTRLQAVAQLAGVLNAPISGLARSLNALVGGLAIALNRVVEQKQGGEDAAA